MVRFLPALFVTLRSLGYRYNFQNLFFFLDEKKMSKGNFYICLNTLLFKIKVQFLHLDPDAVTQINADSWFWSPKLEYPIFSVAGKF
jgi:hypothetical protein